MYYGYSPFYMEKMGAENARFHNRTSLHSLLVRQLLLLVVNMRIIEIKCSDTNNFNYNKRCCSKLRTFFE